MDLLISKINNNRNNNTELPFDHLIIHTILLLYSDSLIAYGMFNEIIIKGI